MRIWPTKRRWKRLAIGAAIIVAVALIANGFMVWWVEHELQTKIAAIRAAGDPASIADLAPAPIPADQNAAAYLEQLAPRLDDFAKDQWHFLDKTPLGKAYDERCRRGEPPTPEQIEAIRAIVDKYPDVVVGLAAAAACERYASMTDFSRDQRELFDELLDKRVTRPRNAARFIDWRIVELAAAGRSEQAAEQGLQLLRLARLHDAEPLLVNFLVGLAVRMTAAEPLYDALAAGPISPQSHIALDEELARHDDPQRLVRALKTERAYCVTTAVESGLFPEAVRVNRVWFRLVGWPMKSLYVNALGVFDDLFELAGRPWYEIRDQFGADGSMPPSGHGVLADLLAPALRAAYEANARNLALMRALRIFNVLTQYRDEHGREASGLEELSLPKEATIDPFSGEPLKLKHTADGWIIYSVMKNGVDDGGDFKDRKDYGLAPAKLRQTEVR
jgi:hypothetical protein